MGTSPQFEGAIAQFEPVQLVFLWTQAANVPPILGKVNFFMEFDACLYSTLASCLFPQAIPKGVEF